MPKPTVAALKQAARDAGEMHYFTGQPCKRGHVAKRFLNGGHCMECNREINVVMRERPGARESASEYRKKWAAANPERRLANSRRWGAANPVRKHEGREKWRKANQPKVNAILAARSRRVKRATPTWVDMAAIRGIYHACPQDMSVDHIVPINGENVCGLHVPWNLQYLTPSKNSTKSNKWSDEDSTGPLARALFPWGQNQYNGDFTTER